MPVTALALTTIMGVTGLVFDSSNLFVNKTKLQNLLDSAALGAASVLSDSRSQFLSSVAARNIITNTLAQDGYSQLNDLGLNSNSFVIQYSSTRNPFVANPAATRFVRVRLNQGVAEINTLFMRIFGINQLDLTGSAVAGPSPALSTVCNAVPTIVCGDPDVPPDASGMYGYNYGDQVTLAMGNTHNNATGPGNFQLLDLGISGNDGKLRESMAGGSEACIAANASVETKPGVNRGPVSQGFNTRFGIYNGPVSADDYPPDLVTDAGGNNYPDSHISYLIDNMTKNYDEPTLGLAQRRVIPVPFGNCDGTINGRGTVEIIGFGCIFLNQPAQNNGALQTVQLFGELVRDCRSNGTPGPDPGNGQGVKTIQLYDDPSRWDS